MKFYEHLSSIDWMTRETGSRIDALSLSVAAYKACVASGDKTSANQFLREQDWVAAKRPYYLVYPTIIPLLTRIALDFPGECVKFPKNLPSLAIRFPEGHNKIVSPFGEIKTILVAPVSVNAEPPNISYPGTGLAIWMNVGETVSSPHEKGVELPIYDYAIFPLNNETIQHCLNVCPVDPGVRSNPSQEVTFSSGWRLEAIRLVITLLLIQDDANLINPDVLARDEAALLEALGKDDAERVKTLADRAFRRRGPGWEIGKRYEPTSGPYVVPPHPQRYWVGKGRTQVVVKTRSGYVVDREKITKIPSGFSEE